jgi:hypothetical protein
MRATLNVPELSNPVISRIAKPMARMRTAFVHMPQKVQDYSCNISENGGSQEARMWLQLIHAVFDASTLTNDNALTSHKLPIARGK